MRGSAPDIAGKGLANPTALLLAAGLKLEHCRAGRSRPPAAGCPQRVVGVDLIGPVPAELQKVRIFSADVVGAHQFQAVKFSSPTWPRRARHLLSTRPASSRSRSRTDRLASVAARRERPECAPVLRLHTLPRKPAPLVRHYRDRHQPQKHRQGVSLDCESAEVCWRQNPLTLGNLRPTLAARVAAERGACARRVPRAQRQSRARAGYVVSDGADCFAPVLAGAMVPVPKLRTHLAGDLGLNKAREREARSSLVTAGGSSREGEAQPRMPPAWRLAPRDPAARHGSADVASQTRPRRPASR